MQIEGYGEGDFFCDGLTVLALMQLYFRKIIVICGSIINLINNIISIIIIGIEIDQYLYLDELWGLIELNNKMIYPIRDGNFIVALKSITIRAIKVFIDVIWG